MENPLNVLILGGGGREHAFAWKIAQSPLLDTLYIAPGNAGTEVNGTNVSIDSDDAEAISAFVRSKDIKLLIVGPEVPLVKGLVDRLAKSDPDLRVIGPKAAAAQLEGSKAFAKAFMSRHQIPTADYREFDAEQMAEGLKYLAQQPVPIVLKADGLAAGKGVIISPSLEHAQEEFRAMLSGKFGAASTKVVIESFLDGIEFSVFVLTDGQTYKVLPMAKDYKKIGEGDTGLNTGGMGSVSPVPFVDAALKQKVIDRIIEPTIRGLQTEQIDYVGFIFFGLINVSGDPYVIEYNCRMGDPETQSVLPRLDTDLIELCLSCANGTLAKQSVETSEDSVASVVLVSGGYPGNYEKGKSINLTDQIDNDQMIFHAGTAWQNGKLITNGGRVLAATSRGKDIADAVAKAGQVAAQIEFEGAYHRRDIGFDLVDP